MQENHYVFWWCQGFVGYFEIGNCRKKRKDFKKNIYWDYNKTCAKYFSTCDLLPAVDYLSDVDDARYTCFFVSNTGLDSGLIWAYFSVGIWGIFLSRRPNRIFNMLARLRFIPRMLCSFWAWVKILLLIKKQKYYVRSSNALKFWCHKFI